MTHTITIGIPETWLFACVVLSIIGAVTAGWHEYKCGFGKGTVLMGAFIGFVTAGGAAMAVTIFGCVVIAVYAGLTVLVS